MKQIHRVFIISATILFTVVISVFFKNKTEDVFIDEFDDATQTLLKKVPSFKLAELYKNRSLTSEQVFKTSSKLTIIHFWATWCAPCEAELKSLVKLIKDFKDYPISFVFIAVKDQVKDLKKYLNKGIKIPENVVLLYDTSESVMDLFGIAKVPETFVFDNKSKLVRKRFIGPQKWENSYYKQLILSF